MPSTIKLQALVPFQNAGQRLDQVAAELFPDYSRSRLKDWSLSGELLVNGLKVKPNKKLAGGESISINATLESEGDWLPEAMPLNIVFEDEQILVLNKPAGLVVHPAAGNWTGTLLNGLIHYLPELQAIPRAGIVHRLDKDTSGIMVVAKTLEAQGHLVNQLQERSVKREYEAICYGKPDHHGVISGDIGRHSTVRTKMAVVDYGGKPAVTHFKLLESNDEFSHVKLNLETGRTHQIRVHMEYIGFPLVGDPTYKQLRQSKPINNKFPSDVSTFPRQALHAVKLGLIHPKTHEYRQWQIALAQDMKQLLNILFERV